MADLAGLACLAIALLFFFSGTMGLLRFPDIYTRLHALTKADNVGMGFLVLGLGLQSGRWFVAAKLTLIWFLMLAASSASCHLVARRARQKGITHWTRK